MSTPGPEIPPSLEALIRQLLGPEADAVLAELAEHGLGLTGPDGLPLDLAKLAADAGLPQDPASVQAMVAQVQRMLATGTGPVNTDLAHDVARQTSVSEGDPTPSEADRRQVAGALQVAELWLDQATDLPTAGGPVRALSRAEWVERTLPRWQALAEPIAASVTTALATTLAEQGRELAEAGEEAAGDLGAAVAPMMRQLGSAVFGMQLGQAVGTLSREVLGTTDTGIPLVDGPGTALLPRNVAAFAEGLDVPLDEVRLFLALREAAHARLFTHVAWLNGHLHGAVDAYARGVEIDLDAMTEAVRSIDPADPQALQQALSGGVFAIGTTPVQRAALVRLETALALVEGWVDEVTAAAAAPHLPHTAALRETMRRRRAAGGPAEDIMATLVGLELRPRRSRDAARLWALITKDAGVGAREHVWDHPDLLPTAEDLDDPAGYRTRRAAEGIEQADVDRALAEIFGEEPGAGTAADEPGRP
jgi:putative hydrolase